MSQITTITELTPSKTIINVITSDFVSIATTTLFGPTLTNYSTQAPAQSLNYKIPLIVVVCIATVFILTIAITLIIRRLRKVRDVQMGEVQSTIFDIDTPQTSPITGARSGQQHSSSNNVNRFLPRVVAKRLRLQRDQQFSFNSRPRGRQKTRFSPAREISNPVGPPAQQVMEQLSRNESRIILEQRSTEMEQQLAVLHEQIQQLSGQFGHLQRQLVNIDRAQDLPAGSDHSEPPAYVQS